MSEDGRQITLPADPIGRLLYALTKALAILGGVLCTAMAVLVAVSVTGRYLASAPVPGDYDLVAIIAGSAVFAFLPYCQLVRGNVVVDFFTASAPARFKAFLDALGSLLFLAVAVLLTWRLYHGALDFHRDNEMIAAFTFMRWWTLPFDIACMALLIIVSGYTLFCDVAILIGGGARQTDGPKFE